MRKQQALIIHARAKTGSGTTKEYVKLVVSFVKSAKMLTLVMSVQNMRKQQALITHARAKTGSGTTKEYVKLVVRTVKVVQMEIAAILVSLVTLHHLQETVYPLFVQAALTQIPMVTVSPVSYTVYSAQVPQIAHSVNPATKHPRPAALSVLWVIIHRELLVCLVVHSAKVV
jgi:hypothetical protein